MHDIAVIIDFWDWKNINWFPGTPSYNRFKSIESLIKSKPSIETIILATYECSPNELHSDMSWYYNSRTFLGSELFNNKLKNFQDTNCKEITFKHLQYWDSGRYQIAMHFEWEFQKYLETHTINNIYMCGEAWDQCVEVRPLGYRSLAQLTKHQRTQFFVKDTCVKDNKDRIFIPEENPNWVPTHEQGIYHWNFK